MKASKRTKPDAERPRTATLPAERNTPWWPYLLGFGLALFALFQVYGPAMRGPFVFDDRYLPFLAPGGGPASLRDWLGAIRPLLMASYWFNLQVNGTDPFGYKLVNVLLHFAGACMVWLALRKLLEWAGVSGLLRAMLAAFGGLLFLLHPVQTESVSYAASRSESLSVAFFYAAFVVFLYRRSVEIGWGRTVAVLALFGCAVLSKEHTVVLPLLLLLTDYFWNPGFSFSGIRRNSRLYATACVLAVAGAAFILVKVLGSAKTAGFGMSGLTWSDYFWTQCRAIWVYVRLFFFPYGQNIDYDFPVSHGVLGHGALIGFLALIGVSVAAWIYRKQYPLASYGWVAFLLLLAPTSSFVPIQDLLVERRLYLPFIGLILVCCEFLRRVPLSRTALAGTLAAVLVVFGLLTWQRNTLWGAEIALWQDTAEKSPRKVRPRFHVAYAYYLSGNCAKAADEYAKAAGLEKPDYTLLVDWGTALDCAGRPQDALEKLRAAAQQEQTAQIYSLIGMIYAKQNRRPEAFEALARAEALDPRFEMTYIYRGNLFLLSQEYDRAAEQFRKALAINPSNQAAVNGISMAQRRVPVS